MVVGTQQSPQLRPMISYHPGGLEASGATGSPTLGSSGELEEVVVVLITKLGMRGILADRGGPKAWAVFYLFFRIKKVLACPLG